MLRVQPSLWDSNFDAMPPSAEALGYCQALLPERILIRVPHEVFNFTTGDKNTVITGMWEPFVRPPTPQRQPSGQDYRRPEGGSHIQSCIFISLSSLQGNYVR